MKRLGIAVAVLLAGGFVFGVASAENEKKTQAKEVRAMDIGQPLFFMGLDKNGQPIVAPGGFIMMLREDGLVAWRMTDEAIEQFRKEAEKGPKVTVPKPDLKSGKR